MISDIPAPGYKVVGTANFSYDGHPDLLFQNQTTGQLIFWYMNGVNLLSSGMLSTIPAATFQIVGPR